MNSPTACKGKITTQLDNPENRPVSRICCRCLLFWSLLLTSNAELINKMIHNARALGLSQYVKAATQSVGGRSAAASFPSLKRDEWYKREETLPPVIPAFANDIQLNKLVLGQAKRVLNLKGQLFNNKSQSITGIGGTLFCCNFLFAGLLHFFSI